MYFSKDWLALVELSFRNFLAEAIEHLPLPTLLRFDTDRLQRSSLQKQVERLQTETADLKQQLSAHSNSSSAASHQQSSQKKSQQRQQSRTHHDPVDGHFEPPLQHHIRPIQEGKAAAPPVAPKPDLQRQHISSDASSTSSSAETSQWGQANGEEDTQSSAANKLEVDNSQSQHPQAGARITPRWSASLASLATSVLAESDSGPPQQQASAAGEPHSLGADAGRLQSCESQTQLSSHAGMSAECVEGKVQSAPVGSGQGNSATGQQQTSTPLQLSDAEPNKDSQASGAVILHRLSDNAETVPSSQSDPVVEQLEGHDSSVTCCTFSPNGQNLATASTDGVVRISAPASLQVQPSFCCGTRLHISVCNLCILCVMYHGRPRRSTCYTG